MRAAIIERNGGPDELRIAHVPDPSVRPGGVIIEVRAIGLQGGDLTNREIGALHAAQHVLGYQASGVVRELGEGVTGLAVGQRVVANAMWGSHAELMSARSSKVWPIPDALSFELAACLPIEFGTAHDALFEFGCLQLGERLLVHGGAGGVGLAAIQLAKRAGAVVLATAGDDERVARLAAVGVDHPVNYRATDVAEAVMQFTEGHGADLVVDPIGGATLDVSIAALAYRGRISWIGNPAGHRSGHRADVWKMMEKNGRLDALFLAMEQSKSPQRTHALTAGCIGLAGEGVLDMPIDRVFPLAEVADAHRYAEDSPQFGRIVLVP
jgi:NADPH2:quinone reductase